MKEKVVQPRAYDREERKVCSQFDSGTCLVPLLLLQISSLRYCFIIISFERFQGFI